MSGMLSVDVEGIRLSYVDGGEGQPINECQGQDVGTHAYVGSNTRGWLIDDFAFESRLVWQVVSV
jgi:hypothetical protein